MYLVIACLTGRMKEDATLRENKVTNGAKIMVVGSTVTDVLAVNEPLKPVAKADVRLAPPTKEPLCKQKVRKTILDNI